METTLIYDPQDTHIVARLSNYKKPAPHQILSIEINQDQGIVIGHGGRFSIQGSPDEIHEFLSQVANAIMKAEEVK